MTYTPAMAADVRRSEALLLLKQYTVPNATARSL